MGDGGAADASRCFESNVASFPHLDSIIGEAPRIFDQRLAYCPITSSVISNNLHDKPVSFSIFLTF